ncbi:glycine rich extracellular protein 1 [Budorcas taxicolor]|uniref:glycine rich extracellular protein 1 n=1 Tax=Budorcas taxicolor TaxID=37181 RepID=UPI002284E6CB|nr:glycine rich extracellular protein 1 [Budorcas taxicolor]
MSAWAFPTALLLLGLTSESLQGGLPPSSLGLGKGLGGSNGYRSGFGNGRGLGAQPGPPAQNGYGAGIGGGAKPQKPGVSPGFRNGNGLGVETLPGAAAQPGYGNALGAGAFPGLGAQLGFGARNGIGAGAFPGAGIGGAVKPQKPGLSAGNGLGAGAFPGAGAQPGPQGDLPTPFVNLPRLDRRIGERAGVQVSQLQMALDQVERGPAEVEGGGPEGALQGPSPAGFSSGFGGIGKPQKPGFGTRNGAQPGPPAQNGYGAGFGGSVQTQKPGFGDGNGLGAQPGFVGNMKPQKPGESYPGLISLHGPPESEPPTPCLLALRSGHGLGVGLPGAEDPEGLAAGTKPQKPGFGNGNGLGVQPGPAAPVGYGPGVAEAMKPQKSDLGGSASPLKPGYMLPLGHGLQLLPGLGTGLKPQKPGYGNGNGLGAQPGPCSGGVLANPPTPGIPSDKGGGWGLKSQPPLPGQDGKFPGHQSPNGYGPGAGLGFGGGLRPQKVGLGYGNGGLGAGFFPEARQQPGFPGANGFLNGQAAGPRGFPWPFLRAWGAALKPRYGVGGTYPEVGSQPGGPEVKRGSNGPLGNGFGGCTGGNPDLWEEQIVALRPPVTSALAFDWLECGSARLRLAGPLRETLGHLLEGQGLRELRARGPGAAAVAKLAAPLPRSRSHPRLARARVHSRQGRSRVSLSLTPPPAPSLPHPPLPGLPPGLSPAPPPPPSVLALAELPPLPALPLRPAPPAPWGPGAHVALPELPPEACVPAPPAAALALQDLPRLPAPAPLPAHLPLPPLPEAAAAATPGPVGARGRPPLIAEPPPQPLPPLPARPSPFNLLAPPVPRDSWPLPALPPPLPPPPPPSYFFLSPPC